MRYSVLLLSFLFFANSIAAKVDSTTLTVNIVKECTDTPIDSALVEIFKNDSILVTSTYTNSDGITSFTLAKKQDYKVRTSKDTCCNWIYFSSIEKVNNIRKNTLIQLEMQNYCIGVGCTETVIETLHYYGESFHEEELHPVELIQFKEIITLLTTCPLNNYQHEFNIHTDCSLGEKKSSQLCKKRIKYLKKVVKEYDLAKKQVLFKNYGATRPINSCNCDTLCLENQLQENNRIHHYIKDLNFIKQ